MQSTVHAIRRGGFETRLLSLPDSDLRAHSSIARRRRAMAAAAFSHSEPVSEQVDPQDFRNAMAHLGAAVHVITTDGPAGPGGFTASAVTSVTDTPPTLLVCVNRNVSSLGVMLENGVLCVNTLGTRHREVSRVFSTKVPMAERFAAARWQKGATGSPVLADAVVSFDCRISNSIDVGTHMVLFCHVAALPESGGDEALIYFRRAYHRLGSHSYVND
jgi:flavin reductase